ncbi:MAG: 50S ribosomal protein L22 [Deltaproteobacteria bacterium]|jgi:large subunit ribosomal protein L22|nr:50S ribosomal protein L22 [Deltaproteobacteria bacterium]
MKRAKILPKKLRPKKNLTAEGRYLRCPPDKARIRARTLKDLSVERAVALLARSPASSARLILKVLKSAVANAVNGDPPRSQEGLVVESVQVGKASMLKRHHPVSHGAAKPILKRNCHIWVKLRFDAQAFDEGPGSVRLRRKAAAAPDAD